MKDRGCLGGGDERGCLGGGDERLRYLVSRKVLTWEAKKGREYFCPIK